MLRKMTMIFVFVWASLFALGLGSLSSGAALEDPPLLGARTIAIGIPGAGAVARIGEFLSGPLKGAPQTASGKVLDPNRVLVASTSNFGASVWMGDPGTILSIDPRASNGPLVIPERFALGGGQAGTLNGAVFVFTSNNATFVNSILNPLAETQILPAVSVPTGISIDNAYGGLALSSSVGIRDGEGWESILDAGGRPMKGPFPLAGGVFAGVRTNRQPPAGTGGGLIGGSLGTAFLGLSVDGGGREVFAVTNGDGTVAQVHIEQGVDGLIFKGLVGPYSGSGQAQESWGPGGVMNTRAGMLFRAEPQPALYVCDPSNNWVLVYDITFDRTVFRGSFPQQIIFGPAVSSPVDIAPAAQATTGPFSNTTLAAGTDLYVANRGNGTITHIQQGGRVVSARRLRVDGVGIIGPGWINGIGLSKDGTSLYVTLTGPIDLGDRVLRGLLVSIPTF